MGQTESPLGRRASWKVRRTGAVRKHQDFDKFIAYLKKKKKKEKKREETKKVKDLAILET